MSAFGCEQLTTYCDAFSNKIGIAVVTILCKWDV